METQMASADEDTGIECHPTDGTGYQTVTDSHVSTAASTSRPFSHNSVHQSAKDHIIEDKRISVGAAGDDSEPGKNVYEDDTSSQTSTHCKNIGRRTEIRATENQEKNENIFIEATGFDGEQTIAEDVVNPSDSFQSGKEEQDEMVVPCKEDEMIRNVVSEEQTSEHGEGSDINSPTFKNRFNSVDSGKSQEESFQSGDHDGNSSHSVSKKPYVGLTGFSEEADTTSSAWNSLNDQNGGSLNVAEFEKFGAGSVSDRVFITESNPAEDEGSDVSDVRAKTPDWVEEDDKEEEASVSGVGRMTLKQEHSSINSQTLPLTHCSLPDDIGPGHRAVANTPASHYTTTDMNAEIIRNMESRNTSRAGIETAREAAFQHAMSLMTSRCDSKQGGEDYGTAIRLHDSAYGPKCPQYFYVQQRKPSPMAPLKAWRGYHGNVYFEPMQIRRIGDGGEGTAQRILKTPISVLSGSKSFGSKRPHLISSFMSMSHSLEPVDSQADKESMVKRDGRISTQHAYNRGARSTKSAGSFRSVAAISQHHVLYLDRKAVACSDNSAMHEELQVIEKQQSTGSLNIQQQSHLPHDVQGTRSSSRARSNLRSSSAGPAKINRICKGSVAHQLKRAKSGGLLGNTLRRQVREVERPAKTSVQLEELVVIGDKFATPSVLSPLLRTQTQYSLSNQRMTMNSPDLYGAYERLHPLEQVRISLRHMDTHSDDTCTTRGASPYSTTTSIGVMEELKPFVKYRADIKTPHKQQIKYY